MISFFPLIPVALLGNMLWDHKIRLRDLLVVGVMNDFPLSPFECEYLLRDLKIGADKWKLEDIGSDSWLEEHGKLERINKEMHLQAIDGCDEFIFEGLLSAGLIPSLISELILIETWKQQLLPHLRKKTLTCGSIRRYLPVFHEACLCNILQTAFFHSSAIDACQEGIVDLVDYCYRKISALLLLRDRLSRRWTKQNEGTVEERRQRLLSVNEEEYDAEQFDDCEFQIAIAAISIIRFIIDNRSSAPLAVTTRLLDVNDILLVLVPLMEAAPWLRKTTAASPFAPSDDTSVKLEQFQENRWVAVDLSGGQMAMPPAQVQVWLCICGLVLDEECMRRYDLGVSLRVENLLRLRKYLNEVIIDQLPMLSKLLRVLEEISVMHSLSGGRNSGGMLAAPSDPASLHKRLGQKFSILSGETGTAGNHPLAATAAAFTVELIAETRERLMSEYRNRWEEVAAEQHRNIFGVKDSPEVLKKLGALISLPPGWNDDDGNDVNGDGNGQNESRNGRKKRTETLVPLCPICEKEADQRCTLCRKTFYCSRECQEKHWDRHRFICLPSTGS